MAVTELTEIELGGVSASPPIGKDQESAHDQCSSTSDTFAHLTIDHGDHIGFVNRQRVDSVTQRVMKSHRSLLTPAQSSCRWYRNSEDIRFAIVFSLTLFYFFVELAFGMSIKSLALVADAMHMLSDVVALFIGWYVTRATRKSVTLQSTYGWTRMEIVGALINGTFMLSICLNITLEAVQRVVESEDVDDEKLREGTDALIVISIVGLCLNVICFFILGIGAVSDSHSAGARKPGEASSKVADNSPADFASSSQSGLNDGGNATFLPDVGMNMKGVLIHVLGDALGSVAVIASSLFIKYTSFSSRFLADPICSLIIVVIIVVGTIPLVRQSASILLMRAPDDLDAKQLVKSVLNDSDVLEIHDFHLWTLSADSYIASMHVTMLNSSSFADVSIRIKNTLSGYGVDAVTIQPEYISSLNELRSGVQCRIPRSGAGKNLQAAPASFQ